MTFTVPYPDFIPHPLLKNPHAMTIAPVFIPRAANREFLSSRRQRLFQIGSDTQLLAFCHWHAEATRRMTVVILHGLEGSSESSYVLGLGAKAFASGLNVIRLNMRNCGDTMHLTPTLYNGGLSSDVHCVLQQLAAEGHDRVALIGYSLGGNLVLKAAGELGNKQRNLAAVAAVSPAIDLELSVQAIERRQNRIYEQWFLRTLKQKIIHKSKLFPQLYDLSRLPSVQTLRMFDDTYTAPNGGYGNAANYYQRASAIRVAHNISVPGLIVASQDDPLVPFAIFCSPQLKSSNLKLVATAHGGHAAFVHHRAEMQSDVFWAENRIVDFLLSQSG